jgi:RNA polymerase subunit RPABC4/transcription elongation factor Spt4
MEKYYCVKCMILNDDNNSCIQCGNQELKRITISVQQQHSKYIVEE